MQRPKRGEDDEPWSEDAESDSEELAACELDAARELLYGPLQSSTGGLIAKLEADPAGRFGVSEYSMYCEEHWVLSKPEKSSEIRILFNSELAGAAELKRMLTYHLLPQFHPFGRLKSYISTRTYAYAYKYVEEHLLRANCLTAEPDSLKVLTARMVNAALDRARDIGTPREYFLTYFLITFWISLSVQSLLPSSHRLDVPLRSVDTEDRRKDIQNAVSTSYRGWQPYSESELSKLLEYALFWTEKGIPVLLQITDYLNSLGGPDKIDKYIIRAKRNEELESVLGQQVDGVTICGFQVLRPIQRIRSSNGKMLEYRPFWYSWKGYFLRAVDRVKDSILILVALITALRNRELGILEFSDVVRSNDGEWRINIVRFKTSGDPNFFGTPDHVPLPTFIGEFVSGFEQLRAFHSRFWRKGCLFEQVANSRESRVLNRSVQRAMINMVEDVGVSPIHPHRFRKTMAEILLSRSERNIELVRLLFGHRTYRMSLRYIARNPYLVSAVAETMGTHFTETFVEIAEGVQQGAYSGIAAERIAATMSVQPKNFKGRLLRIAVYDYIFHLLEAGEPVFIQRTGLGTYCVSGSFAAGENYLPCSAGRADRAKNVGPDPMNCQLQCKNIVVLESAKDVLQKNITFYSNLLEQSGGKLKRAVHRQISTKLAANRAHLLALTTRRSRSTRTAADQ